MTVVIEEELLCITRSGADAHDFTRESVARIQGDYGELEDPTPWEVQEAIARIKQREMSKGLTQAKVRDRRTQQGGGGKGGGKGGERGRVLLTCRAARGPSERRGVARCVPPPLPCPA